MEIFREKTLGIPCYPFEWASEPKYIKASLLTVTTNKNTQKEQNTFWYRVVDRTKIVEGIHEYHDIIEDKMITINSEYIVEAEDYLILETTYVHKNDDFTNKLGEPSKLKRKCFLMKCNAENTVTLIRQHDDNFEKYMLPFRR